MKSLVFMLAMGFSSVAVASSTAVPATPESSDATLAPADGSPSAETVASNPIFKPPVSPIAPEPKPAPSPTPTPR